MEVRDAPFRRRSSLHIYRDSGLGSSSGSGNASVGQRMLQSHLPVAVPRHIRNPRVHSLSLREIGTHASLHVSTISEEIITVLTRYRPIVWN